MQNFFDMVINGEGFFQIQMFDGMFVYICDGVFQKDNIGQVVIFSGYFLLLVIMVLVNVLMVLISCDGVVSVMMLGNNMSIQVGIIQFVIFVNIGGLQSMGENLFVEIVLFGVLMLNILGLNGVGLIN